jgi:hypothetical protein
MIKNAKPPRLGNRGGSEVCSARQLEQPRK